MLILATWFRLMVKEPKFVISRGNFDLSNPENASKLAKTVMSKLSSPVWRTPTITRVPPPGPGTAHPPSPPQLYPSLPTQFLPPYVPYSRKLFANFRSLVTTIPMPPPPAVTDANEAGGIQGFIPKRSIPKGPKGLGNNDAGGRGVPCTTAGGKVGTPVSGSGMGSTGGFQSQQGNQSNKPS